jgi:mitofilin
MLRQVFKSTSLARQLVPRRSYAAAATSAQKRSLNKEQLGSGKAAAPSAPAADAGNGNGGAGGGSSMPIILGVLAIAGAGAAYSMDLIPKDLIPGMGGEEAAVVAKKEEVKKDEAPKEEAEKTSTETTVAESGKGNRVVNITLPHGSSYSDPPAPVTGHPFGGNKVAMNPPVAASENKSTVDDALQELQSDLAKETSKALGEAHQELAKLVSLDLSELDSMSQTQLKIRLVQMARDLEERTKWEAVRLKEFLALKEKEVEDK